MIAIDLPILLPTLNEYTSACRGRMVYGARVKRQAQELVEPYLLAVPPIPLSDGQRLYVAITWTRPNTKSDPDNIAFAKKFVLDGLVRAGIIPDDSPKYIAGFRDAFAVGDPNVHVELTII